MFEFKVKSLICGSCDVLMRINDKTIRFNASYLGPNPLADFIDACAELPKDDSPLYSSWAEEPGSLEIEMNLHKDGTLSLDIIEHNEVSAQECHETVSFDEFKASIIAEGYRVLNAFGLRGYKREWIMGDFPITNLVAITEDADKKNDGTTIKHELDCIKKHTCMPKISKATHYAECVISYAAWQIQCCGEPFSVGEKVDWTCKLTAGTENHGIMVDFLEEHHGQETHRITGRVAKIVAERSENPGGTKVVDYETANTILKEIQYADGWESELESTQKIEHTFWGYFVTLEDVTVKPLK